MDYWSEANMGTELKFGIPDLELSKLSGGKVSPATFVGHALVVLFCPHSRAGEAAALDQYSDAVCELSAYDAWLLVVIEQDGSSYLESKCSCSILYDPEGAGWDAFAKLADPDVSLNRDEGATFLFSRGGALHKAWRGIASPERVLHALAERAT